MSAALQAGEIAPGRLYQLLLDGSARLALAPDQSDLSRLFLVSGSAGDTEPEYGDFQPLGRRGGGLARLIAHIARMTRTPAVAATDAPHAIALPDAAARWIADPALLWAILGAAYTTIPTTDLGRSVSLSRVDSSDMLSNASDYSVWACRLDGPADGTQAKWIVAEPVESPTERSTRPGRDLAAGLQILREALSPSSPSATAGAPSLRIRAQDPTAIRGGATVLRIDTGRWRCYWPSSALAEVTRAIVGGDADEMGRVAEMGRSAASIDALAPVLAACIVEREIAGYGLVRLSQFAPRTAAERSARHAIRTVGELLEERGAAARTFVESAYRSGDAYADMTTVLPWLGMEHRDIVRRTLGRRRFDQLDDHSRRRLTGRASGPDASLPWDRFSRASRRLVERIADRAQRPGRRPPAAATAIITRSYIEPRGRRLQNVWRSHVRGGELARRLQDGYLSRLRRDVPKLPREVLVFAAAGESAPVKERIASVFSRRGGVLFLEDVAAVERTMERGEFRDWDRVLAARRRLETVAIRAAGAPARGGRR